MVVCLRVALAVVLALSGMAAGVRAQSLKGVNLEGAEYNATKLPGVYGTDFVYPNHDEVSYFVGKGMNVFRFPVLWERLQPRLEADLSLDETQRLSNFIEDAESQGASVIIDVHNFGHYRDGLIGQAAVSPAAFADFWGRLARRFGQDRRVLFGLMNEPQLNDGAVWQGAVQGAINSIRGAGGLNRILVPGLAWDGAHSFVQANGDTLGQLKDPLHRLVYEVHQYFDADSSGTSESCVAPDQVEPRFAAFTQWLRDGKRLGFLGEFGVSRRPECVALLSQVMNYLKANSDVWLGWTYWAAGPIIGDYMFSLEPVHGEDRPQMKALAASLRQRVPAP